MEKRFIHLMYVPFTGLGLYGGYRGNRWLKNRIKVFSQFVVPSLQAQTNPDFTLWISWRHEDKNNPLVQNLYKDLKYLWGFKVFFTYTGVCFWDDKYPEKEARVRLIDSIHGAMGELVNVIGEVDEVYMTIQPSDDLYHKNAVEWIQDGFKNTDFQAIGFTKGYICNYLTKEVAEYNPNTNPPFYTLRFPRQDFVDPLKHLQYTSLKHDSGPYKQGIPLPSHEYVKDCLNYGTIAERGFMVGTHTENISTHFNHPFKGQVMKPEVLQDFGIDESELLHLKFSIRKRILRKLPHKVQRKLRYVFGEKLYQKFYDFIRS